LVAQGHPQPKPINKNRARDPEDPNALEKQFKIKGNKKKPPHTPISLMFIFTKSSSTKTIGYFEHQSLFTNPGKYRETGNPSAASGVDRIL
jgi:hypothetical protein